MFDISTSADADVIANGIVFSYKRMMSGFKIIPDGISGIDDAVRTNNGIIPDNGFEFTGFFPFGRDAYDTEFFNLNILSEYHIWINMVCIQRFPLWMVKALKMKKLSFFCENPL